MGRDVRRFGAVGDGRTDDTAALMAAVRAVRGGETLLLPAGHTFLHADVLTLTTEGVTLAGGGTLLATKEGSSALQVLADDVQVRDITLGVATTSRRWSASDQHRLFLGAQTGLTIRNVRVTGSAAAGVFCYGTQHFVLDHVEVSDTRADGVHMTHGSADGRVLSPRVSRSGDDGVAVVSYLQDGQPCHGITVDSPVVAITTGGRGVSVVGGHDISYRDIDVNRSSAAGVYVACEGQPYNTYPTERVGVAGGRVTGANTDADIDHGAVLVYSGRGGGSVSDVSVSGLHITDTRRGASRQIGVVHDNDGSVANVTFADLSLAATPDPYEGNVDPAHFALRDVHAAGRLVTA